MEYASNARIIRAFNLLDEIDFSKNYNPTQIYCNSKKSKSDQSDQDPTLLLLNA